MGDQEQWNIPVKDLFSMLDEVKKEFAKLSNEMAETRGLIKKYNGLREEVGRYREEIEKLERKINALEDRAKGRFSVFEAIRNWGGWMVAIVGFIWSMWRTTH